MSKFIGGIVIAAIPVILGAAGTFALPAAASPACMTQEEARKAFPHDHIYWQTPKHCWDNIARHRQPEPAADTNAAPAAAERSEAAAPKEPPPLKLSEALAERPSAPAVIPPVPFVSEDQRQGLSWPVPNAAAADLSAPAQQADPPPPAAEEDAALGAPDATPGSPEYRLAHCCWPPLAHDGARQDDILRPMIAGSGAAFGVAIGLWLLVHRRRRPARRRATVWDRDSNVRIATAAVSRWHAEPGDRRVY
jgi:hypothetical protein